MSLRVFSADAASIADQAEPGLPEPLPIQIFPIDTLGGRVIYAVWFNDEGARCRACPAETCTFTPSPQGVGTCYHNVQGGLGRLSARLSASGE